MNREEAKQWIIENWASLVAKGKLKEALLRYFQKYSTFFTEDK